MIASLQSRRTRLLASLALATGLLAVPAMAEKADAQVICGYVKVTTTNPDITVPLVVYCDSCPNGNEQGPTGLGVGWEYSCTNP